jgi:SAM-dependent methyltransferase
MNIKEKNPTLHNPELHRLVIDKIKTLNKGHVLDIPSGPGYLVKELKKLGFTGIASEIDENLHVFNDIDYKKVDMSKTFPFPDKSFNYAVSIEGIEHIENQFNFIREVNRVLKKDGVFILTTPNVNSLESKLEFLLSNFHSLLGKPIPLDTKNIFFEHINPVSFELLYFMFEKNGLNIEKLFTPRFRKGAKFLYYLLYPLIYLFTYKACFLKEKEKKRRKANRRLFKFLISKENLMGSHTIVLARKN